MHYLSWQGMHYVSPTTFQSCWTLFLGLYVRYLQHNVEEWHISVQPSESNFMTTSNNLTTCVFYKIFYAYEHTWQYVAFLWATYNNMQTRFFCVDATHCSWIYIYKSAEDPCEMPRWFLFSLVLSRLCSSKCCTGVLACNLNYQFSITGSSSPCTTPSSKEELRKIPDIRCEEEDVDMPKDARGDTNRNCVHPSKPSLFGPLVLIPYSELNTSSSSSSSSSFPDRHALSVLSSQLCQPF